MGRDNNDDRAVARNWVECMTDFGITGFGAYIPRLRLDRTAIAAAHAWMAPGLKGLAKGSRAFCGVDEDAITMAVDAARNCLGSTSSAGIETVTLASTTLPYADLQNSAIVVAALGFDRNTASFDIAHSQRAGTSALREAFRAGVKSLVIASDHPKAKAASTQEMSFGAAAAAFTFGTENPIATLISAGSQTVNFVDHFRSQEAESDYFWEERWVRDEGYAKIAPAAIKAAMAQSNLTIGDVTHFVMPSMQRGAADAVAKKVGFAGTIAPALDNGCGYAGAAHALLMLAATLEKANPGDVILVVGFGQGTDAILLRVTDAITAFKPRRSVAAELADGIVTDSYMRMLSFANGVDLEWGMRSEKSNKTQLTEQYRSAFQIDHFVAGECESCGTVQFPQLQSCVKCQAPRSQFKQRSLADEPAQVLTSTADWLTFHPAPPLYCGFVQFDNGARLIMETVDVGPEGVERGAPLRMVFRIKERDAVRGYNRYFWKSTPLKAD